MDVNISTVQIHNIIGKLLSSQRFPSPNPIGRGTPSPAFGKSGGEGRGAGVAPRGNPAIPPHPGRIGHNPRFRNPSIDLQIRQTGDENGDPPGRHRPARCGHPNPTSRSLIGWGSRIKPAPPGDDRFPSPDHESFHTFTTPTTWRRKR